MLFLHEMQNAYREMVKRRIPRWSNGIGNSCAFFELIIKVASTGVSEDSLERHGSNELDSF